MDAIIKRHVEEEKAKRLATKKKQGKELFDSMQNLMKTVDQYVKKEDSDKGKIGISRQHEIYDNRKNYIFHATYT